MAKRSNPTKKAQADTIFTAAEAAYRAENPSADDRAVYKAIRKAVVATFVSQLFPVTVSEGATADAEDVQSSKNCAQTYFQNILKAKRLSAQANTPASAAWPYPTAESVAAASASTEE